MEDQLEDNHNKLYFIKQLSGHFTQ